MLRLASGRTARMAAAAVCGARRAVTLQSEKPCATLADKVVRGAKKTVFYTHPSYVMAREKMLYTLWVDAGVIRLCAYLLIPYFAIAFFFKA